MSLIKAIFCCVAVVISAVASVALVSWHRGDLKGLIEASPQIIGSSGESVAPRPLASEQVSQLVYQQSDTSSQPEPIKRLPASLLGSAPPQSLDVNDDGDLIINKKILHLFDFYLAAMGEEPLELIVVRIQQSLNQQLVSPALEQGLDILTGYLQYLNEITVIKNQFNQSADGLFASNADGLFEPGANGLLGGNADGSSIENIINARAEIHAARARLLTPQVIAAFFEQSDQYEDYMLALVAINRDGQLNSQQKLIAKQQLDSATPAWLLQQRQRINQLNRYRDQYHGLKSQGASDYELTSFTQQQFGVEASNRLAELNQQRERWQQRLSDYRSELDAIIATEPGGEQRQLQIQQLRQIYFSDQEVKRVNALDSGYLAKLGNDS